MARFDFKCGKCGHVQEEVVTGGASKATFPCAKCGGEAKWLPSWSGGFHFAFKDGWDLCTGAYHPNKKHYEEHLRTNNMVKVG